MLPYTNPPFPRLGGKEFIWRSHLGISHTHTNGDESRGERYHPFLQTTPDQVYGPGIYQHRSFFYLFYRSSGKRASEHIHFCGTGSGRARI